MAKAPSTTESDDQQNREHLRKKIIKSLRNQGFRIRKGEVLPPKDLNKDRVRDLHSTAVKHRIEKAKEGLFRREPDLLGMIANGSDVCPEAIEPFLMPVLADSKEELLFRYASLHWSIPVSSGYGRRIRFLVMDAQNGKLIGLIGLGDPVYGLGPRDEWIGWDSAARRDRLGNVMDAFVLGAVPPYSFLLCGKLVAMLATSEVMAKAFKQKYGGSRSLIRGKIHDGRLALVTTTSALGRSSVYNRLRYNGESVFESVGYTKGFGEFQFSNGLYGTISAFAEAHCTPTAKQEQWGSGFRNKREVIKKCLVELELPSAWNAHGIEREVFVAPLAKNTREFLRGEHNKLMWHHNSVSDLSQYFRDRWLLPRAKWDGRFEEWSRDQWLLWPRPGAIK